MDAPEFHQAVVVTGATGAIGTAIIRRLFTEGANLVIIGACRRPERMEALAQQLAAEQPGSTCTLTGAWLDLSTTEQARRSAQALTKMLSAKGCRLQALVNNAGTMPVNHLEVSSQGFDMAMQVNCISTLAFTLPLLPLVPSGGVVVMTSSVMRHTVTLRPDFAYAGLRARTVADRFLNYARSKLLLTIAARQMAGQLVSRAIRVNCADPGVVDSGIITLGYPWVDKVADYLARPLMSTPERGAQAAIRAMTVDATGMMCTPGGCKAMKSFITPDEQAAVSELYRLAGV